VKSKVEIEFGKSSALRAECTMSLSKPKRQSAIP